MNTSIVDVRYLVRMRKNCHHWVVLISNQNFLIQKANRWLTALTIDCEKTGFTATELIEKLQEHNIEARPVWKPMHLQPLYEGYEFLKKIKIIVHFIQKWCMLTFRIRYD